MKKLLVTLTVLMLMFGGAAAQDKAKPIQFTGASYGTDFGMTAGIGIPVGGNLWSLSYTRVGLDGENAVGTEVAYIRSYEDGGLYYGVLAGNSAEWVPNGENDITYLAQAGGAVLGYKFSKGLGLYGWAKYRLQLTQGTSYPNNLSFGLGVIAEL